MWQQYVYRDSVGSHLYSVYTPDTYRVGTAIPLVVMLHGCTQTALDFAAGTLMNQVAEQHGFIVVYPQQTSNYNQNLCWNWFLPANQSRDTGEPASVVGIIRAVQQNTVLWTIDPERIYVAGLSAGGAMAVILGTTYPDIFAAIGVHSGIEYQGGTSFTSGLRAMRHGGPDPIQQGQSAYRTMKNRARVIPTIVFHGTQDTTVVPINGDQVVRQWMQTDTLASQGSYAPNFTSPDTVASGQVPNGRSYVTASWKSHSGDETQVYWKIGGMGHAWSGGSPAGSYTDPFGPSASQAMYTFFSTHTLHLQSTQQPTATSHKGLGLRYILSDLLTSRRGKRTS